MLTASEGEIVLGIDPGSRMMGYALLQICGNKRKLILMDTLVFAAKIPMEERLVILFHKVDELIRTYSPKILAIESPFYGKNVQSMLKLGRAQGIAIAAALANGIPFIEYAPRRIKQSITGKGAASKEQVALMTQRLVPFDIMPKHLDTTDALAVALCYALQNPNLELKTNETAKSLGGNSRKNGSWSGFLTQNPSRIAELKTRRKP